MRKAGILIVATLLLVLSEFTVYADVSIQILANDTDNESEIFTFCGAQVRCPSGDLPSGNGSADMRFIMSAECNGITVDDNGIPDYSSAEVTVVGKNYTVHEFGILLILRDRMLKSNQTEFEALTVGTVNDCGGHQVTANHLYSYTSTEIIFTAMVTGIPYTKYGTEIYARPYAVYATDDDIKVAYGEIVHKNLYEIWRAAARKDPYLSCGDRMSYLRPSVSGGYFAQNAHVLFFGDSITYAGLQAEEIFRYWAAVHPEDRVQFYVSGVLGGTTAGALAYMEEEAMWYEPDVVVLAYGFNDIGYRDYTDGFAAASPEAKARIDTFAENTEMLIHRFREKGVQVILCTPPPWDETNTKSASEPHFGANTAVSLCAEKVRALAEKYHCLPVDYNACLNEKNAYVQAYDSDLSVINTTDRVHPGIVGHDLMARTFLRAVGENRVRIPSNQTVLRRLIKEDENGADVYFADLGLKDQTMRYADSVYIAIHQPNESLELYWRQEFVLLGPDKYFWQTEEKLRYVAENHTAADAADYAYRLTIKQTFTELVKKATAAVYG